MKELISLVDCSHSKSLLQRLQITHVVAQQLSINSRNRSASYILKGSTIYKTPNLGMYGNQTSLL